VDKIIIFRPGALGDTLLAFPALAALRCAFADTRLIAIGNALALALARDAGLVDEAFAYDLPWWSELFSEEGVRSPEARRTLAGARLVLLWLRDPDGLAERNLRALGVASLVNAPGRPPEGARIPAADYLLRTLDTFLDDTARAAASAFVLPLSQAARVWAEAEWARRSLIGSSVLVLHPGSGGRDKCWPPERFAALAGRFLKHDWRVLIIEGPADEEVASQVMQLLPAGRAQRVSGLALPQLAALLARATLFVGNDSGVTHLSGLVGAPTLALFGPTDPAIWAPRGPRVRMVEVGAAVGAPMGALSVNVVWAAAQEFLTRRTGE
jgi:heptosyltransferase-3